MRVFVSVDMEGISGICQSEQVRRGESLYGEARRFMVADANACAEGCFRAGADEVVIWDAHGGGHNMPWSEIDSRVVLSQGSTDLGRMHDVGEFDAVILLGYHAMAGTRCAVLEHTMSSAAWQRFWLNGREAGEIAIDAGIAGDAGVPVVMVSGCDKACAEARSWIEEVATAQVKQGLSSSGARLLPGEKARALITETAERAVRERDRVKPLRLDSPVAMRLEMVERHRVPGLGAGHPYLVHVDGRTYEVKGATVREALSRL